MSLNRGIGNSMGRHETGFSVADAAKNRIDHVPTLRNPRHERFAQELATGKTADAAYGMAGYRENRSNAARLSANQNIQKRVAEIQAVGAELAAITVETLIAEAEAARSKAMVEKGGAAAAVAAITAKAKLAGLWREKVAQTDPSGAPLAAWVGVVSCVHLRSLHRDGRGDPHGEPQDKSNSSMS